MSESLDETIARTLERLQLSRPLNIHTKQTIEETVGAALADDVEEAVVQIGIDQDSVIILEPEASAILSKKPKSEAYTQMITATKADHRFKRKLLDENLKSTQQHIKISLVAASLGFLIVLGGVVALMLGYSRSGIVISAAGAISELVSALFFNQARHFNDRLDRTLNRLLDVEGFFKALAIVEQLPEGALRDYLFEAIVKEMIGISSNP